MILALALAMDLSYASCRTDDDVAAGTVGVNPRGGEVERGVPMDAFLQRLGAEVAPYAVVGA